MNGARKTSRHNNLGNPTSDPALGTVEVRMTVHFDLFRGNKFPKIKLQEWLEALPAEANIQTTGISNGKLGLQASWLDVLSKKEEKSLGSD